MAEKLSTMSKGEPVQHFFTSRKVANGLGAAHTGTAQHWFMTVTAVALAVLTPFVIAIAARGIGLDQVGVAAYYGRPRPAIILGLFLVVGMIHWISGTRIMIDDYLKGATRMWTLVGVQLVGWAVIAVGLYALVRMALVVIVT